MMTPKEKAQELLESFIPFSLNEATTEDGFYYSESIQLWNAKQCALIACNEVLGDMGADRGYEFWTEVKQEIEKL